MSAIHRSISITAFLLGTASLLFAEGGMQTTPQTDPGSNPNPAKVIEPKQPQFKMTGRVERVDTLTNQVVVKEADGTRTTLQMDSKSKVLRNGKTMLFSDLKKGKRVNVQYDDATKGVHQIELIP